MSPADLRTAARAARQAVEARADRLLADADLADALVTSAAHFVDQGDDRALVAACLDEAADVCEPYRVIAHAYRGAP